MTTDTDIEVAPTPEISPVQRAREDVEIFHALVQSVLAKGRDFAPIPGTGPKPVLLKPGAERLLRALRLRHDLIRMGPGGPDDAGIIYRCEIRSYGSEEVIAACERYAGLDELDRQGRPKWTTYNTMLAMAQKRALVGATLQATGASGDFTSDLEDDAPTPPADPVQEIAKAATAAIRAMGPEVAGAMNDYAVSHDRRTIAGWADILIAAGQTAVWQERAAADYDAVRAAHEEHTTEPEAPPAKTEAEWRQELTVPDPDRKPPRRRGAARDDKPTFVSREENAARQLEKETDSDRLC